MEESVSESEQDQITKLHNDLFWNNDTCYCVIDSLIIFSPHISAKKAKNKKQLSHIREMLQKIMN